MGPKADVTFSHELDARMVPTEVSSKDNGIMLSQGQGTDKTLESVSSIKEAESSQSSGRSQTLDQIVQKAAIYLKNGRHEVKIDLKPEYLGHVRLQIATENHLVTLRVLTEFPLVKDMLESNLHQLKADLHQQGLEIDELDVSVAHDANQFGGNGNKTANDKTHPFSENDSSSENTLAEEEVDSRYPSLNIEPETGIDYFV
jgi:flagellar hook-length control protein FliK